MHLTTAARLSEDLQSIKDASGSTEKLRLAAAWSSIEHRTLLNLIGNADMQWHITWRSVEEEDGAASCEWDDIWYEAANRVVSPTITARRIRHLLNLGYPENVLRAIVEKTPDCGLSIKQFKKAIGESRSFQPSLANSYTDMPDRKIVPLLLTGNYYTTPKMDGLRSLWVLIPGQERVLSRQMKPLLNQSKTLAVLMEAFRDYPCVVDGELLAADNTWETSMTAAKDEGSTVQARLHPFDCVSAQEYLRNEYSETKASRLAALNKGMGNLYQTHPDKFQYVPFIQVKTKAAVAYHLENHLSDGWEGSVLHDLTALYRPTTKVENRSDALIKVKKWLDHEFTIDAIIPGTGKHYGRMGSVLVKGVYKDREILSEVGTGFTDSLREEIWADQRRFIGRTVTIKFFQVTKGSLRFPSFLRFRDTME